MKLWPRTLGVQLIMVTASAVLISNLAVAAWFQLGNQRMSESDQNERLLDRAASMSTLLAAIPAKAREGAGSDRPPGAIWGEPQQVIDQLGEYVDVVHGCGLWVVERCAVGERNRLDDAGRRVSRERGTVAA